MFQKMALKMGLLIIPEKSANWVRLNKISNSKEIPIEFKHLTLNHLNLFDLGILIMNNYSVLFLLLGAKG